jgi:hypothetical protein
MSDLNGRDGQIRTTKQILAGCQQELEARLERLEGFVHEHAEVKRAISVLERAANTTASKGGAQKGGPGPRARFRERVRVELSQSLEPLTAADLRERTSCKSEEWLQTILDHMMGSGELVRAEDGYGLPTVAVAAME